MYLQRRYIIDVGNVILSVHLLKLLMQLAIVLCWKMYKGGFTCMIWCLAAMSHWAAFGLFFKKENILPRFQPRNTTFENCSGSSMDLVMLLDSSFSVGANNFLRLKELMTEVVASASIDDGKVRVAVVTFSTSSAVEFYLDDFTSKKDVQKKIKDIVYLAGSTNIASGLSLVKDEVFQVKKGDRPDIRNVLLLIVDGPSNTNSSLTIPTATLVKESGVHVFVLGIQSADVDEITGIASDPTEINCIKGQFDDFEHIEEYLFKTMCTGVARAEAMSTVTTTAATTSTITDVSNTGRNGATKTTGTTPIGTKTPHASKYSPEVTTTAKIFSTTKTAAVTDTSGSTSPETTTASTNSAGAPTAAATSVHTSHSANTTPFSSMTSTPTVGLTVTYATSYFTTTRGTGTTSPVTSATKDTISKSSYTPPMGSTTPSPISPSGPTTTTRTQTTNPATTTPTATTAGLTTYGSTTAGVSTFNACYRKCDLAAAYTPETTDDFIKDLQLPKRKLSKKIGERTSTSNLSKSEMVTGIGVSLVLLTPFAFLVGWDVLDFIRYIYRMFRNKGRQ